MFIATAGNRGCGARRPAFRPSTTNSAVIRCSSNSVSASSISASAAIVLGSRVMNSAAVWSSPLLDVAPQVAVGDHADEIARRRRSRRRCRAAWPTFRRPRRASRYPLADQRQRLARMHQPADRLQPRAERAARMEPAEIAARESLLAHDGHRQRVAERQRHRRRGGRRDRLPARPRASAAAPAPPPRPRRASIRHCR